MGNRITNNPQNSARGIIDILFFFVFVFGVFLVLSSNSIRLQIKQKHLNRIQILFVKY